MKYNYFRCITALILFAIIWGLLQALVIKTNYDDNYNELSKSKNFGLYKWKEICMNGNINIPSLGKDGTHLCENARLEKDIDVIITARKITFANASWCVWSCESTFDYFFHIISSIWIQVTDITWKMMIVYMVGLLAMVASLMIRVDSYKRIKHTDKKYNNLWDDNEFDTDKCISYSAKPKSY
jgi:hypothetical protein